MTARAFCTVTASTKRNADLGSGRTGAAATYLATLAITPLWPPNVQTFASLTSILQRPAEAKECYHVPSAGASLPDVKEGDILVIGANEYPIQYVAEWTDGDVPCLHIIVQEVKGT